MRHDGKVLRCYTAKWFRQPILKPQAKEDGARGCKSLSHTLWDGRDPILFIPQYRRKVFFKEIRKEIGEILRTLGEYQDVEWVERRHEWGSRA